MKTKFEDNVASEEPRAAHSTEPELPWQVNDEDIAPVDAKEAEYKAAITGAPPLKINVVLIVLLILSIFAFISNTVTNIAIDKYEAESAAMQKGEAAAALRMSLVKSANEKRALNESSSQLEKRVNELTAQKDLYTAVLETLTKKADDTTGAARNPQ